MQTEIITGNITSIEWQKKNKERVNVHINGFYAFSCHIDLVLSFQLEKGKAIDEKLFLEIHKTDQLKMAYLYGLRVCLMKTCSELELKRKLDQKQYDFDVIEQTLTRLIEEAYLDDERYAELYIESKRHLYGEHRLRQGLRLKGIDQEIIDKALKVGLNPDEAHEEILELALKKMRQCEGLDEVKMLMRVSGLLLRRGYGQNDVHKALKEVKQQYRMGLQQPE